ncbi:MULTISPECIES: hypothetical protein [Natrialbaceae]|uniref:hypothetical protein n=1 Tax=Natrialbaceae TaxID=1644061 RepID=UPI00207D5193|nr:hypothetical protein [Natronococcus sp. CG52]
MEKSRFGCFLHDVASIFGEVSILGLPVLMYIATTGTGGNYGVTAAALVAWTTMVFGGALVRGGSIRPLGTETLGWVTFSPSLIGLRLVYYNAVFLAAAPGGVVVATAVGTPTLSLVVAFVVAALATLSFPRLGEAVARSRQP